MTTETNAERLESAKRLITAVREANSVDDPKKFWSSLLDLFGFGYLDSLLQQAERAQELSKQAGTMMWDAAELAVEKRQLEIDKARLREALELADRVISDAIFDLAHGEKVDGLEYARQQIDQALKGESE